MAKIRVIDFFPHINGMTTYAKHACAGLLALGHDAAVLSFTKSGKKPDAWANPDINRHGGRASHIQVNEVLPWSEAAGYLKTLDGVILNEPRNTILDNQAQKDHDDPPYMQALVESQVPWSTMLGCPQYTDDYAPFLTELVEKSNVRRAVVAFPSFVPKSFVDKPGFEIAYSNKYPYSPTYGVDDPIPTGYSVCTAGRLAGNKSGWTSMLAVLSRLDPRWTYEIWGTCGKGVGPSTVVQMIEALSASTCYRTPEEVQEDVVWSNGDQKWRPFRTDAFLMVVNGRIVKYGGGFLVPPFFHGHEGHPASNAPAICLNLSSASFTTGTIEYIGLEALDAGCVLVTAPHLLASDGLTRPHIYAAPCVRGHFENAMMRKEGFMFSSKGASGKNNAGDVEEHLIDSISKAQQYVDVAPVLRKESAIWNRRALRVHHDPAEHAKILTWCLGLQDSIVALRYPASQVPRMIEQDHFGERYWNPRAPGFKKGVVDAGLMQGDSNVTS